VVSSLVWRLGLVPTTELVVFPPVQIVKEPDYLGEQPTEPVEELSVMRLTVKRKSVPDMGRMVARVPNIGLGVCNALPIGVTIRYGEKAAFLASGRGVASGPAPNAGSRSIEQVGSVCPK
jgi:hypothetical protein